MDDNSSLVEWIFSIFSLSASCTNTLACEPHRSRARIPRFPSLSVMQVSTQAPRLVVSDVLVWHAFLEGQDTKIGEN